MEFVIEKEHKCADLNEAIEIIQDCKRYVKIKTKVDVAKNEAKKKQDQQNDKKKLKLGGRNICRNTRFANGLNAQTTRTAQITPVIKEKRKNWKKNLEKTKTR